MPWMEMLVAVVAGEMCSRQRGGTHRNVTQDGQQDVDEEISIATALEEDTQRRKDDGKKDLANVAGGEGHDVVCLVVALREEVVVFVRSILVPECRAQVKL